MISNSIVILASVLAFAFVMTWLMRRDIREQIERPKYRFQDQLQQYDRQCHITNTEENKVDARD